MEIDAYVKKLKDILPDNVSEKLNDEETVFYIFLGGIAVIVLFYVFFLLLPLTSDILSTRRNIQTLREDITFVETRVAGLDALEERVRGFEGTWESYSDALPREKEIPGFLEELSDIAKRSRVSIVSITPSSGSVEREAGELYRPFFIEVQAKSGFHQLGEFIGALETGKRVIAIENLVIRGDRVSPRVHDIEMQLKTYVGAGEDEKR